MKCKRILALALSLVMIMGLCSCGTAEESIDTSSAVAVTESAEEVPVEEATEAPNEIPVEEIESQAAEPESVPEAEEERTVIEYPLTDEDLEISLSFDMPGGVGTRFTDFNEHAVFAEMESRTGVHLTFIANGGMSDAEALTLWAAAGELPDLIPNGASNYPGGGEVAVADGILMDVSEYLEYAPDYDYYRTRTEQDAMDSLTDSGYLVTISSYFSEDLGPSTGPMIRQDWLDALSLDTPVTYDDWHDVLTAFMNEYNTPCTFMLPNTLTAQNNYFASGFGILGYTANARGRVTDPFYQVDGEVKFSLLEDEFLNYVTLLHDWYDEGLINSDFLNIETDTNGPDLQGYVSGNQTGIWFGDISQMGSYKEAAADPNFNCVAITDPVQNEGDVTHFDSDRTGLTYYSVAATCENPEVVMKWINYWYTEEGQLLANYGIEDVSFTMSEDGTPQFTDLMLDNPDGETFKTCQLLYTMIMMPTVVDSTSAYATYNEAQLEAQDIWSSNIDDAYVLPGLTLTTEESEEYSSIYSDLSTMISETLVKFINGDRDLSEWPEFVSQMEQMGARDCVDIYQAAMDRYLSR